MSTPSILVKGGEIDLYVIDVRGREHTIVVPSGYGLAHDPSGRSIEKCSLFVGPIEVTEERVEKLPKEAAQYFGDYYEARKAYVDIPGRGWNSVGQVAEIIYFRPGKYSTDWRGKQVDWRHEFSEPVPLFKSGRWWKLKLPKDCSVTYRGIERP